MSEEKQPFCGKNDPLYDEAVQLVRSYKKISTSMIQRHLRIGYNRARLIIEAMVGEVITDSSPDAKLIPVISGAFVKDSDK